MEDPELGLGVDGYELYRTHWAIKEPSLADFLKKRSKTLEGVFDKIKQDFDTLNPNKPDHTKVTVLYACNASGKTRLSKLFADQYDEQVLCYNALTEDYFSWDNESNILEVSVNAWIIKIIQEQGLDRQIIDNFQEFSGSKLEPRFELTKKIIQTSTEKVAVPIYTFTFLDLETKKPIKISRGEESIFIWSIFYTILEATIDTLNEKVDDLKTSFDNIQYIVIDDPVSSMDDTRIITVAIELAKLIKKSNSQLKFLITTHHALFFNVLFNLRCKKWDRKNYILSKSGLELLLKKQGSESPFAYHHVVISEIAKAKKDNDIKKYHFNIFRALLEKTANFLGYDHWKICLQNSGHSEAFTKIIDHYSHDRLSDLEYRDITVDEKNEFVEAFNFFIKKYDFQLEKKHG